LPSDIQAVALHKLRLLNQSRAFGMSEGFFLGLQMDYDLMQRRREIDNDLKAIRPRAA
jgi:plasmid maintenance system antidote protein VapI